MDDSATTDLDIETTRTGDEIVARYGETDAERVLVFERRDGGRTSGRDGDDDAEASRTAVVAQNREGYGMVRVRRSVESAELERYYGFEMALDHAAEVLGVDVNALPIPEDAADMGM